MQAIRHFPEVEKICSMMASTDLIYQGMRIIRLIPYSDEQIQCLKFTGGGFLLHKDLIHSSDFTPFEPNSD